MFVCGFMGGYKMKKGKSILTRCLALVLALVLIVSSANLSAALKVSANSETTVTTGDRPVGYLLRHAESGLPVRTVRQRLFQFAKKRVIKTCCKPQQVFIL